MGCHGGNTKGRHTGLDSKLSKLEHTVFNACGNTDMENPPDQRHMGAYAGIIGYIDRLIFSGLYKAQENQQST